LHQQELAALTLLSLTMDIDAYLARLAYTGPTSPSAATLSALHLAHLSTVPFENLDIGQTPIVLDEAAFFAKIVRRRRGGFCYELNGLFAALLRELGFRVTLLSGRVATETGGFGPEFDHLALLVDLDERWLVDVGFGDSFLEPLRLASSDVTLQRKREFRLDEAEGEWLLQSRDGEWEPQFRFTLEARSLVDFAGMCFYHQTSPESVFTRRALCSIATESGRVTLVNNRLIVTRDGEREERPVAEAEKAALLRERFGVVMA
jgi:N-hydroxyarylamine O-acetyltransferase